MRPFIDTARQSAQCVVSDHPSSMLIIILLLLGGRISAHKVENEKRVRVQPVPQGAQAAVSRGPCVSSVAPRGGLTTGRGQRDGGGRAAAGASLDSRTRKTEDTDLSPSDSGVPTWTREQEFGPRDSGGTGEKPGVTEGVAVWTERQHSPGAQPPRRPGRRPSERVRHTHPRTSVPHSVSLTGGLR